MAQQKAPAKRDKSDAVPPPDIKSASPGKGKSSADSKSAAAAGSDAASSKKQARKH